MAVGRYSYRMKKYSSLRRCHFEIFSEDPYESRAHEKFVRSWTLKPSVRNSYKVSQVQDGFIILRNVFWWPENSFLTQWQNFVLQQECFFLTSNFFLRGKKHCLISRIKNLATRKNNHYIKKKFSWHQKSFIVADPGQIGIGSNSCLNTEGFSCFSLLFSLSIEIWKTTGLLDWNLQNHLQRRGLKTSIRAPKISVIPWKVWICWFCFFACWDRGLLASWSYQGGWLLLIGPVKRSLRYEMWHCRSLSFLTYPTFRFIYLSSFEYFHPASHGLSRPTLMEIRPSRLVFQIPPRVSTLRVGIFACHGEYTV